MENYTPQFINDKSAPSKIFTDISCSSFYIETINKDTDQIILIFRNPEDINSKKEIKAYNIKAFKEIKLIIDFQCLSKELSLDKLKIIINDLYTIIIKEKNNIKLSLVIENTLIKTFSKLNDGMLILNELIIGDELYNISPNLNIIFPEITVNKLTLKKFKINSRLQLSNFCDFIIKTECKELTLEDIFIELIIKKDENDIEYNEINNYFKYNKGIITLNDEYTSIKSLTLRDCPLFVITENMFTIIKELEPKIIDIDENSIINPSIITKFKINKNEFDICFDLDSYKIGKEEDENNEKEEGYLSYLEYIFNIIIGFSYNDKIKENVNEEDEEDNEDDENIGNIDREYFYKLKFKNFDMTKYEYITNDYANIIKEENWILNNEEKKRKEKWEKFEEKLKKFNFKNLLNVKMLVFENCSNFFIQWILYFIKGNEISTIRKSYNNDLELLKLKKCGKDYIDLKNILKMKINKLILFDTPLIIDHFNEDNKRHLDNINNNLGSIQYLTIIINTLDFYNKEFKLNIYKTMEIIVELIQCSKYNKNISFGMKALSMIMTFLVYKEYYSKKEIYNNPNIEEKGEDILTNEEIEKINKENKIDNNNNNLTTVCSQFYFCCKKYRDYIINKSFKLNSLEDSKITIINTLIKNQSENFDCLNYLLLKYNRQDKRNRELKKIDFGLNLINVDKDYKTFFSINCINTVILKNVELSHSINSLISKEEGETIINLISYNEKEKDIIKKNNYPIPIIPNYKMDIKTLNGILFKNHLFEDIGSVFKYFMMKIDQPERNNEKEKEVKREEADKKTILMEYFNNYIKKFKYIQENITEFTFVIYDRKELKELNCILGLAKVIYDKKNWIKEKLIAHGKLKEVELPNKKIIEKEIGPYFLKDKNEEEEDVYSEFNYYFSNYVEQKMLNNKKITINDYTYYLEFIFD